MKLYVMRHAHSPSIADAGVRSDAERPLSEQGREQARSQAERLVAAGGKPRLILHSPLRRAVETAQEAAAVLRVKAQPFAPLSNELAAEALAQQLSEPLTRHKELLIIGHQPQVGELGAWLAGQLFDFKPATVLAVEADAPLAAKTARLIWCENP